MEIVNITDEDVIALLWPNKTCLINRKKNIPIEYINYLNNRFKYSESLYESLYCIKYKINRDEKICPVCGKGILKFNGSPKRGIFNSGCCIKCSMKIRQDNLRKSNLEKYGVEYTLQIKEIRDKIKETNIQKYGGATCLYSKDVQEKIKQHNLEKYGVEYVFQAEEVKNKIKQTNLKRYGVENSFQSDIVKQHHKETLIKKYGVENSFLIPEVVESFKKRKNEIQQKRDETKRRNGTFGVSYLEEKTYNLLLTKFLKDDILREYKDKNVYNHKCDFYIKSIDTWIECNYFWTHQVHFFNKDNESDILILNSLKEKAINSKFYKDAIKTWTERDIEKYNDAKNNSLNYVVFWNYSQAEKWINNFKK